MMRVGDRIEHPETGETMVFLQTGTETGGELLQIDMFVRPGGSAAVEHVHPHQEERFIVRRGRMTLRIYGREITLDAGQEITVAPGVPHVWWNSGDDELNTVLEFRPGGRFAEFITSFFALAQAGRTNATGIPNLLQTVVTLAEYRDVLYVTSPPRAVQTLLFAVLAPLGRLLGYRADHPYPWPRRRGRVSPTHSRQVVGV